MAIRFEHGRYATFQNQILLGDSRVGKVFSATQNNMAYAIKRTECPTIEARHFASREAEVLRQLDHRHIVRFVDSWFENSETPNTAVLFLQMELCEIATLRHHFNDMTFANKRREGLDIFKQIASAIQFIHGENLVHCNLEPWNILFQLGGHTVVKIGNFSFVSKVDPEGAQSNCRPRGIFARLYMCPEQARNAANPNPPTFKWDIYNMGLIFLEVVNPINTDTNWKDWIGMMGEAEKLHLPQTFNEVGLRLERGLIQRLLSHDPNERPTAADIIKEVDEIIAGL